MLTVRLTLRSCAAALVGLALVAPVQAGVPPITPTDLTLGTTVTIDGSGFDGGKTPKVIGCAPGSKKLVTFKVVSFDDTQITAVVKKIPSTKKATAAGKMWTLKVQPKGPNAGVEATIGTFTTVAPTVLSVNPASADPKEEVVVTVQDPGSTKLKATINGKRAKVVSVEAAEEEGTNTVDVTLRVPNTHNGFFDIFVTNKVGQNPSNTTLQVTGSKKDLGKDGMTATVDGKKFVSKGKNFGGQDNGGSIDVTAANGKNPVKGFTMGIPFDVGADALPQTYTMAPAVLTYGEETIVNGISQFRGWIGQAGNFEIDVAALANGRMQVDFDGVLDEVPPLPAPGGEGELIQRTVSGTVILSGLPLSGTFGLDEGQEVPPTGSAATGTATVTLNPVTRVLTWNITFTGLEGAETAAHLHGPAPAGQNALPIITLAPGSPKQDSAILTAQQSTDVQNGLWYINIHSSVHTGGEIRGQIVIE